METMFHHPLTATQLRIIVDLMDMLGHAGACDSDGGECDWILFCGQIDVCHLDGRKIGSVRRIDPQYCMSQWEYCPEVQRADLDL